MRMDKKKGGINMDIWEQIGRITLGFLSLFLLTRILGRKEISQMTFFNFVSAISIVSIAANFVLNKDVDLLNGLMALTGWTLFTLVMAFMDIKSKALRRIITGDPVIVIKDGKIVEKALSSCRLDLDSLTAMLRQQNIFSFVDIDYAIFETNGKLSVLLKESKKTVIKKDMNISVQPKVYPIATEVISDGKIIQSNVKKLKLDEKWIDMQLKAKKITVSDVLFAQLQTDGSLYIDRRTNN